MMIGDGGDGYQFASFQYLAKKLFFEGKFPFGWTNFWRYPYGINFQNSYDSSLLIIFGIFLYTLTSNPILVYNLSIFFLIFLALVLAYSSYAEFFDPLISVIGAIIYGLSFFSIARLGGHPNIFFITSILFFYTSLYRIYRTKGSTSSFIYFSAAALLVPFSSMQFPLLLVGSFPFIFLLLVIFYKKELFELSKIIWQKKVKFFAFILIAFFVFLLFHANKLIGLFSDPQTYLPEYKIISVPAINFVVPNSYLKSLSSIFANSSTQSIENVLFLGYGEMILFVFALTTLKKSRTKTFLIIAFSVFLVIALGKQNFLTRIWPYQYLFNIFPYRGITEPGRFVIFVYLAMAGLILKYLNQIKDKKTLFLILFVLVLERMPVGFYLSPSLYEKKFISILKNSESKAIINLPSDLPGWNDQYYDIYSVYSDKPMVNWYIQWSGDNAKSRKLLSQLNEYRCYHYPAFYQEGDDLGLARQKKDFLLKTMINYDIKTMVVYKDFLASDNCRRASFFVSVLLEDTKRFQKVFDDGDKEVLSLRY